MRRSSNQGHAFTIAIRRCCILWYQLRDVAKNESQAKYKPLSTHVCLGVTRDLEPCLVSRMDQRGNNLGRSTRHAILALRLSCCTGLVSVLCLDGGGVAIVLVRPALCLALVRAGLVARFRLLVIDGALERVRTRLLPGFAEALLRAAHGVFAAGLLVGGGRASAVGAVVAAGEAREEVVQLVLLVVRSLELAAHPDGQVAVELLGSFELHFRVLELLVEILDLVRRTERTLALIG
jgi:hypothetical protein